MDGLQLAQCIKTKQISPKELLLETIDKIEQQNHTLNAVVRTRYEKALKEAETLERKDLSQLLYAGVPIVIKDLGQQLKGEYNTSGSKLLKHHVSRTTDYLIEKIQQLGFIIVGQTNTPEFGFLNYTKNTLYGVTKNPLDETRHAGGSSGGAASVVASGMMPIALASDGGGSIRIPASFTNLIGLKPSRGRIPVGFNSFRGWQGASVSFPITKYLSDTRALFYALQTEQFESPFILPLLNQKQQLQSSLKIAYSMNSPVHSIVSEEAKKAVLKTVSLLESIGYDCVEISPEIDGVALMKDYYMMNGVETASLFKNMEHALGRTLTQEDMEPMSWLIYQSGVGIKGYEYSAVLNRWDNATYQMKKFHEQYDLFVTPTVSDVAPKIEDYELPIQRIKRINDYVTELTQSERLQAVWDMFEAGLALTPFTQQANLTGCPAMSLPLYKTSEGLPIGVQFSAFKGREDLLLLISEQLACYFV